MSKTCPKCGKNMVIRNGKYGKFWGCSGFPHCRNIVNIQAGDPATLRKIKNPSHYQQAVFDWVEQSDGNAIGLAAAGSGKTTTIEHVVAMLLEPKGMQPIPEIVYAVFNSHVQKSAAAKGLPALTTHSMGFSAIRNFVGTKVEIEDRKVGDIVKELLKQQNKLGDWAWMIPLVCNIVGKLKNMVLEATFENIGQVCEQFSIETNGSIDIMVGLAEQALTLNNQMLNRVDYDDMIYLPVIKNMPLTKYDWVLGDEVQDYNNAQIQLIIRSLKVGGRALLVGDKNQSMYGFRGADIFAIDRLKEAFGAVELPLSITYRCPTSHVELVNELFPEIPFEAFSGNRAGTIDSVGSSIFLGHVSDGDLVLCRTNAPLVKYVFDLIRRGQKAIIRGRDIGENLIGFINKFKEEKVTDLFGAMQEYKAREVAKLAKLEKFSQIQSLEDKIDTIIALGDGCNYSFQIIRNIQEVFSDAKEGVVFSTVHRAKGDEADNVYILQPQLMPHPMAKKDWEVQQEKNILYVALTRAKRRMVFVDGYLGYHPEEQEVSNES